MLDTITGLDTPWVGNAVELPGHVQIGIYEGSTPSAVNSTASTQLGHLSIVAHIGEGVVLPRVGAQEHTGWEQRVQATIDLLQSWQEGDEQEQRETWEYLKKALDEDRPSQRKLFP